MWHRAAPQDLADRPQVSRRQTARTSDLSAAPAMGGWSAPEHGFEQGSHRVGLIGYDVRAEARFGQGPP